MISLLFSLLLNPALAAKPLKFPPKQDLYEFNMTVRFRLTMAHYTCDFQVKFVDFEPENGKWFMRDMDQLKPCDAKSIISNTSVLDDVIQYAGKHDRILAMNDKSPGEPMIVHLGSEVIIRVDNRMLLEGVTLHIHGMNQKNHWFADGVAFVQQCPISARSLYTYKFIADTPGTLWYHGHLGPDRGEGLLGAFIVVTDDHSVTLKDGSKVVPDVEYAVMLQDWPVISMHEVWYNHIGDSNKFLYGTNSDKCWAPTRSYDGSNVGGSIPISAILFNDKGWYDQEAVKTKPWTLPLEIFKIKPGQNVLLRILNGGNAQELMVSVEGHKMYIVAADGVPVHETEVDMVVVFPAERYDILIKGKKNTKKSSYYIIAETLEYYDWFFKKTNPRYGLAVLDYGKGKDEQKPADLAHSTCTMKKKCLVMNCPFAEFPHEFPYKCMYAAHMGDLKPAPAEILATKFNKGYEEHFLNMHFDSHINGWRFKFPRAPPYLFPNDETHVAKPCIAKQCKTQHGPLIRDFNCYCFHHLNLTLGNVVQLTIYNMGNGSKPGGKGYGHPLHIHGYHFYVMKIGFPSYDKKTGLIGTMNPDIPCNSTETQCNYLQWTNETWLHGNVPGMSKNPSSRDTAVVPLGGYIVIRMKADNPGWFFAHCHVVLHQVGGMAFALRVGTHEQMAKPPKNWPRGCGIFEPSEERFEVEEEIKEVRTASKASCQVGAVILDTSNGVAAAGVTVTLYHDGQLIDTKKSDANGRIACLHHGKNLTGNRVIHVAVKEYFDSLKQTTFFPFTEIEFSLYGKSYEIPVLISRYGYTTYMNQIQTQYGFPIAIGKRSVVENSDMPQNIIKTYESKTRISSHFLDISNGQPAGGVHTKTFVLDGKEFKKIAEKVSDQTGAIGNILGDVPLTEAIYKLTIDYKQYYGALTQKTFYPSVHTIFQVTDANTNYHIVINMSPYSYTVYKGFESKGQSAQESPLHQSKHQNHQQTDRESTEHSKDDDQSFNETAVLVLEISVGIGIVALVAYFIVIAFRSSPDRNENNFKYVPLST